MTQSYNLSQLANNLNSAGQLDATDGLVGAVPVANGGTGASTAANARTNLGVAAAVYSVPTGGIIMWSGSIASIPTGWLICDGTLGTPNLRDRFVIGAGSTYAVAASGGSADAIVVSHTHTASTVDLSHTHTYQASNYASNGQGGGADPGQRLSSAAAGTVSGGMSANATHTHTIASTGATGTNANLPPYYALAFIMKS